MSAITGKLRGRDVQRELAGVDNLDPRTAKVLYLLAEQGYDNSKMLAETLGLLNKVIDQQGNFNLIATNMKNELNKTQRNATDPAPDLDNKQ